MFAVNICSRCERRYDDIGLSGCFCPSEREVTVAEEPKKNRITAAQWQAQARVRVLREQEQAEALRREEEKKYQAEADEVVDAFMDVLAEGRDPWGNESYKTWGRGSDTAMTIAQRTLFQLGFKVTKEKLVHSAPGGRGKMEETYEDPRLFTLRILKP